ncbi:MAG: macrolide ABC transporter ATP-binding protein [Gammaproteobacteria bacterium GWE2_42_36]|nr:MAG: macrolide ABC transporter ATP-binding protein [Gammaproteobacteria bacterium GWE2_42_36]
MSNPIVIMQEIRKTYQSGGMSFEALKGIDLQINAGEYISILGPSGSGKSTLMHIIGCLSTPTSGRYVLNGREVSHLNRNELASVRSREIGFVFQSFNLLPYLNVLENVMLPLDYQGIAIAERIDRATVVVEQLGLLTHRAHRPNQLSGGQQQRVAIARALVTQPNILLADEPTGNLDSQSGNEVIKLFEQFSSEGKTVILVTHDLAVAKRTRRMIKIYDGLITEDRSNE